MKQSSLLSINPELQRNIWLELSPARFLGLPLVIALLAGIVYKMSGQREYISAAFGSVLWVLMIFWGPWLAAGAVIEEISGRTWDVQRLSAQRALNFILGKFFGSTIYIWYGTLLCSIGVMFIAPSDISNILDTVLGGLLAMSMAMFSAIVIARRNVGRASRTSHALAFFIGVFFSAAFTTAIGIHTGDVKVDAVTPSQIVRWYGVAMPTLTFWYRLEAFMSAWIIFGTIRLMRRELGYRDGPLGWSLFTLYTIIFIAGWTVQSKLAGEMGAIWQGRVFLGAQIMAYAALLGLPATIAISRKLTSAIGRSDLRGAWRSMPGWMPSAGISLVAAGFYAMTGANHAVGAIAMVGFLCRDVIVVYGVRSRFVRRSEAILILYFVVMYLVPGYAITLDYKQLTEGPQAMLLQALSPLGGSSNSGAIIPWIEALALYGLLRKDIGRLFIAAPKG